MADREYTDWGKLWRQYEGRVPSGVVPADIAAHIAMGAVNPFKDATDVLMDRLGLSLGQVADVIDVAPREVRRWRNGSRPAPVRVVEWVARFAAWLGANPVPLP